jgi:phosphatidylethanolamine/phosphatidyl-N-methylethanolamine N-methyltransferase
MDHRVEGFPFNVLRDPMYVGSAMSFVGASVWYESPAGLLISLYVYVAYVIALRFEGWVPLFFFLVLSHG